MKFLKKYLKSNCIKSELVQKDFSSILLTLQGTSLYSPEIVRATLLQNTSVWTGSVFIYYNNLAILILIIS